jgi:hypothetical protein
VQGIFAIKIESCVRCEFFLCVAAEEDVDFVLRPNLARQMSEECDAQDPECSAKPRDWLT